MTLRVGPRSDACYPSPRPPPGQPDDEARVDTRRKSSRDRPQRSGGEAEEPPRLQRQEAVGDTLQHHPGPEGGEERPPEAATAELGRRALLSCAGQARELALAAPAMAVEVIARSEPPPAHLDGAINRNVAQTELVVALHVPRRYDAEIGRCRGGTAAVVDVAIWRAVVVEGDCRRRIQGVADGRARRRALEL